MKVASVPSKALARTGVWLGAAAAALLLVPAAWSHDTGGWPSHFVRDNVEQAVCFRDIDVWGHSTSWIQVLAPEQVYAANRTSGRDVEYVYWRGEVQRWNGRTHAWYDYGATPWVRTLATDSAGIQNNMWPIFGYVVNVHPGHYRVQIRIYWTSLGASHAQWAKSYVSHDGGTYYGGLVPGVRSSDFCTI